MANDKNTEVEKLDNSSLFFYLYRLKLVPIFDLLTMVLARGAPTSISSRFLATGRARPTA